MAADLNSEKLIARYLLGDLPEEQQVEIEDRAFSDKDYLATVTAVENDLIDEYVRQELSQSDRSKFEQRFLASAARRKRVEFAKALTNVMAERPVPARTVISQPAIKWTFGELVYAFISGLRPAAKYSLVAVLLLLVNGGSWLVITTLSLRTQVNQLQVENQSRQNERQALEQQIEAERRRNEELNARLSQEKQQREQTDESLRQLIETGDANGPRSVIASLTLLPGLSRGSGAQPSLVIPDEARLVRFQIGIGPEEQHATFAAEIRTAAGGQVWTRDNLTARNHGEARSIELMLPVSALKSGDYELRLSGVKEGGGSEDAGFYYFDVKKK